MVKGYFMVCLIALGLFFLLSPVEVSAGEKNVKILVLMTNTNYGPNIYFTRDDMQEWGWEVTLAGITSTLTGCAGFGGLPKITVDTLVSQITKITDYDVLAIGHASWRQGDAYRDILNNQAALNLVKSAADSGLVIWAMCGGVRVLAAANVIQGKNVIGAAVYLQEYEAAGAIYIGYDHAPVIDGNIITCVNGQTYHTQNCEAIAIALQNR